MQLRINSQMARIGLKISEPIINLQSTKPRVELEITPPQLNISSPRPQLRIDQSQCFADAGLQGQLDFTRSCSDYSRSEFFEGLAQRVSNGNALAAIHTGFSIADLGVQAAQGEQHIFNIKAIPQQRPIIEAILQDVSVSLQPGRVNVNLKRGYVDNQLQRGVVQAYLAQRNYLDIQWIDERRVDTKG